MAALLAFHRADQYGIEDDGIACMYIPHFQGGATYTSHWYLVMHGAAKLSHALQLVVPVSRQAPQWIDVMFLLLCQSCKLNEMKRNGMRRHPHRAFEDKLSHSLCAKQSGPQCTLLTLPTRLDWRTVAEYCQSTVPCSRLAGW